MPQLVRYVSEEPRITIRQRVGAAVRSFWRPAVPLVAFKGELGAEYGYSGDDYAAGVYGNGVDHNSAFTFSAVYDAVNQISSDVAKLPLNLRKYRQQGGSDIYEESDVHWLFKRAANPETKAFDFRRTVTAHALTCHGGFAEIQRDGLGRPRALWILTPDRVRPHRDRLPKGGYGPLVYKVDGDRPVPPMDMLHIRGLGYDGTMGYDLIDLARRAIGLALSAEHFGSTMFRQGLHGGVLNTEDDLDEDQQKAVRGEIDKYKAGFKQFLTLFSRKWSYQRTTASSGDVGLDRTREQQIEDVARFFNMPIHKLKVTKPGTMSYASVEANSVDYLTGCLMNWLVQWEAELNFKLVPSLEKRQQFFKHNAAAIVRGDIKSRYDAYAVMLDRGVISADEVRELEDWNPQVGGQGAMYLVQGAMVPKDKVVEMIDAKMEKDKMPPAPPQPTPSNEEDDDDRVRLLTERAERAEDAAREAQEQAARAREATAAADASAEATTAERDALREAERRALEVAAQLTLQADALRAEASALRATIERDRADRESEHAALLADVQAAQRAAEEARTQLAAAEQARSRTETELAAAVEMSAGAQTALRAAEERAATALAERDAALATAEEARRVAAATQQDADRHAAAAATTHEARLVAQEDARAAVERAEAAEQAALAAQQQAESAQALAGEARSLADTAEGTAAELRAEVESLQASEQEARAALDLANTALMEVRCQVTTLTAERDQMAQQRVAAETRAQVFADRLQDETTAHQVTRQAAEDREASLEAAHATAQVEERRHTDAAAAASIAAHRELVVDIMGRMVERESDRARKAHATPEKFRRWAETFYEGHEDLLRSALLPAVRIHLAFIRSDDDPVDMARRLAAGHVDESRRQLLTVMDGDADEIGASIGALMHRWESERPNTIANLLMQKELEYVARR